MTKKPNILVIFNDDHGAWATGPYGNRTVHTPSIDHLAATGTTMRNAFTPTPSCSPARACFFTGRLASQHGVHDYVAGATEYREQQWLRDEFTTLVERLAAGGYRTGLSGKWHLGRDHEPFRGFDSWFALDGSYPINQAGTHGFSFDGNVKALTGYKTPIITDQALSFLRTQPADQPFFLFVGYTATHSPWSGHPERLVEQFRNRDLEAPATDELPYGKPDGEALMVDTADWRELLAQYYAAIAGLDEGVGRILDELDALSMRDDTLVIYTSDHGLCGGHHGIWGKSASTLPVNFVEESIRIPLILSGPGIRAAQQRPEMVDHLDLYQTILEFGLDRPDASEAAPGRSFLPLLAGNDIEEPWRAHQMCEYGSARMIRDARHKLIWYSGSDTLRLFDLEQDPGETRDLAGEPRRRQTIMELKARLDAHFARYQRPDSSGLNIEQIPSQNQRQHWE